MEIKMDGYEKQMLIEELAKKITKKESMWAMKEAIKDVLKEEMIDDVIQKATEKAIKDLVNWKIIRENVYYGIQIEKMENEINRLKEDFKKVVEELGKINTVFSVKMEK